MTLPALGSTDWYAWAQMMHYSLGLNGTPVVGQWYPASPLPTTGDTFQAYTQNTLYLEMPRLATTALTIDQLATNLNTAGSSGAVSRMGIYQITTTDPYAVVLNSAYATLLVDGGTVATDTTGTKTLTLGTPQAIAAGTFYAIGIVDQVASPASHRMRAMNGNSLSPWGSSAAWSSSFPQVVTVTGVTGALPSTFTPTAFNAMNTNSDNGVMFHRSA